MSLNVKKVLKNPLEVTKKASPGPGSKQSGLCRDQIKLKRAVFVRQLFSGRKENLWLLIFVVLLSDVSECFDCVSEDVDVIEKYC